MAIDAPQRINHNHNTGLEASDVSPSATARQNIEL